MGLIWGRRVEGEYVCVWETHAHDKGSEEEKMTGYTEESEGQGKGQE